MNPLVALTFVFASAAAGPTYAGGLVAGHAGLVAGHGLLGAGYAGHGLVGAGYAHAAAAPVAVAAAPVAPLAYHAAEAVVPAPYTTATQAEGVTSVHQPAPVVTKQVHLGQTSYVSGHTTRIIKPPTPHLPIAVPTVLRGSHTVNPAVVSTQTQVHTVNEPVYVERRVEVPYDVPVYKENLIDAPYPVHVDAPYEVPVPVAVQGEPIIRHSVAPAVHTESHHVADAGIAHAGYAHAGVVGAGYGHAGVVGAGYGHAGVVGAGYGYGLGHGLLAAAE